MSSFFFDARMSAVDTMIGFLVIVALVVLVLIDGLFALSELAVVSAQRSRRKVMATTDWPGAASALALGQSCRAQA